MDIDILRQENQKLKEENKRLYEIAYLDKLTGAYSRTWWMENVNNESKGYFIFADINCLRTINFILGHNAGDELIVECAEIFKRYGKVVRLGGDEFVIICDNRELYEECLKLECNKFSMGGCYKTKDMTVAEVIHVADQKLYEAKKYIKTCGDYIKID